MLIETDEDYQELQKLKAQKRKFNSLKLEPDEIKAIENNQGRFILTKDISELKVLKLTILKLKKEDFYLRSLN